MARRRRHRRNYGVLYRKYHRRTVKTAKFLWAHKWAVGSLILSVAVGIYTDRLFDISDQAQGIVTLNVVVLCAVAWALLNFGYGAIYVIRGLHPLTGVYRVIYVGLTERPPWTDSDGDLRHTRIDEHIFGSDRYRKPAPPWADTAVAYYLAHESYWFLPGVLRFFERVNIKWRRPLYNDKMNRQNPDYIDATTAKAQRAQRDQGIYTQAYLEALEVHTPFLTRRVGQR